ncbi:Heat-stable enterotoxin C [Yersinia bercovieri ATCC 43970]|uniref:Heat-stable enterotoxin C n=1 Tax=Yersinia bercovieri ATCC 43970 TaxID=349968 RepID=A0ABM9XTZ5_YERBE|nr:Heat-stable enterotoxin C [Yersinia bercovieri ATCC 43970]
MLSAPPLIFYVEPQNLGQAPNVRYFLNMYNRLMMMFINTPHTPDCNIAHSTSHNRFPKVAGN